MVIVRMEKLKKVSFKKKSRSKIWQDFEPPVKFARAQLFFKFNPENVEF